MLRKKLEINTFTEFQCTGDKCPLTCCTTLWGISVSKDEIAAYKKIRHPFTREIISAIDEPKEHFKGDSDYRCKMLTKEGLCKIVINFGPGALCTTCKLFPRAFYILGDIYEAGVSPACPVVVEKLFNSELPYFNYYEEEIDGEIPEDTDYSMYDSLSPIRNFLIELLMSDCNEDIYGKIFIIIDIVTRLKAMIKDDALTPESAGLLLSQYDNEELISSLCAGMKNIKDGNYLTEDMLLRSLHVHLNAMKEIAPKLVIHFKNLNINKYIADIPLLAKNINKVIEFTRKSCPYFLRNLLINKLFLFFVPKGAEKFGSLIFQLFNELFLAQFVAGIHYGENNGITLEDYAVIISEIDRITAHSTITRDILAKACEKLTAKNYLEMLMF